MVPIRAIPRGIAQVMLLLLALPLMTLILSGCGNSMSAATSGDPGGITSGSRGDVVGQVDGAPGPLYLDKTGRQTTDAKLAAVDKDGKPALAKDKDNNALSEIDSAKDREPLAFQLSNVVGQNRIALNIVCTLITGSLV